MLEGLNLQGVQFQGEPYTAYSSSSSGNTDTAVVVGLSVAIPLAVILTGVLTGLFFWHR